MNQGTVHQIYSTTPHALVTGDVKFAAESSRDFDLEASIQFTNDGQATHFDFSSYILVEADNSDLEEQRSRIVAEITAINNLLEAVEKFHGDYLTHASRALDLLAALQTSATS